MVRAEYVTYWEEEKDGKGRVCDVLGRREMPVRETCKKTTWMARR
jgi:hypothetical protein